MIPARQNRTATAKDYGRPTFSEIPRKIAGFSARFSSHFSMEI
jgi:hypothetical protein